MNRPGSARQEAVVGLEALQGGGTAVIHTGNEASARYGESYIILGPGAKIAVSIRHLDSDEREVTSISCQLRPVGCQADSSRCTGCMYLLPSHLTSLPTGYGAHHTRLKPYPPLHMILRRRGLTAYALRAAIDVEFYLVGPVVVGL